VAMSDVGGSEIRSTNRGFGSILDKDGFDSEGARRDPRSDCRSIRWYNGGDLSPPIWESQLRILIRPVPNELFGRGGMVKCALVGLDQSTTARRSPYGADGVVLLSADLRK
jgi:hypothetical protein